MVYITADPKGLFAHSILLAPNKLFNKRVSYMKNIIKDLPRK